MGPNVAAPYISPFAIVHIYTYVCMRLIHIHALVVHTLSLQFPEYAYIEVVVPLTLPAVSRQLIPLPPIPHGPSQEERSDFINSLPSAGTIYIVTLVTYHWVGIYIYWHNVCFYNMLCVHVYVLIVSLSMIRLTHNHNALFMNMTMTLILCNQQTVFASMNQQN